jgi:membrane protein YqaA with SNARE-associated domain
VGLLAPAFGVLSLIAAAVALQVLIVADVISRYVVPLPSDVAVAIVRILRDEHVVARFLLTSGETFGAGLLIVAVGYRLVSRCTDPRWRGARSKAGWRHGPRRRWCWPIRCSWCCSAVPR